MGYTKLFAEIVASTIWREDDKTRLVWITMLAMKNERHMVEASVPGLADLARVTLKECEEALDKLSGPDKYSRNQVEQGRRIKKLDGGWLIINGEHYRAKMSAEDRKEYQRNYQRDYRKGIKRPRTKSVCTLEERNYMNGVRDGTIDQETGNPIPDPSEPFSEEQPKDLT